MHCTKERDGDPAKDRPGAGRNNPKRLEIEDSPNRGKKSATSRITAAGPRRQSMAPIGRAAALATLRLKWCYGMNT